ncbi:MAG TPA: cupin domain-containing protein [Stellaceae bacterium]|nr:cupin domain-containing protein [Stellaceae bacterium]
MAADGNIFADIPATLAGEAFGELLVAANVRIERIVSRGHASAPGFWYDQDAAEWVMVLQGAAEVLLEGAVAPVELRPGDYLYLTPHTRHRVQWTDPDRATIWLAVHIA